MMKVTKNDAVLHSFQAGSTIRPIPGEPTIRTMHNWNIEPGGMPKEERPRKPPAPVVTMKESYNFMLAVYVVGAVQLVAIMLVAVEVGLLMIR